MFVDTVSEWNVTSENICKKKQQLFFGSRLEISTFQKKIVKSKTLTDAQFFQFSLTGFFLAKFLLGVQEHRGVGGVKAILTMSK